MGPQLWQGGRFQFGNLCGQVVYGLFEFVDLFHGEGGERKMNQGVVNGRWELMRSKLLADGGHGLTKDVDLILDDQLDESQLQLSLLELIRPGAQ